MPLVGEAHREALASRIIVGSVRHMMDVNEALHDGAHIVTVPPPILRKMLWNPRTESTIRSTCAVTPAASSPAVR